MQAWTGMHHLKAPTTVSWVLWMLKDEGSVSFIVYSCAESDTAEDTKCSQAQMLYKPLGTMASTMIHLSTLTCLPCWEQTTPASLKWKQSWMPIPLWGQSSRVASFPLQPTSSKKMDPNPGPKLGPNPMDNILSWVVAIASVSWNKLEQVSLDVCI